MTGSDTIIYAANAVAKRLSQHTGDREKLSFFLGQLAALKASLGHFFGNEPNAAIGKDIIDGHMDTINAILAR